MSDKLESNSTHRLAACRGERKHFTPNIITDKRLSAPWALLHAQHRHKLHASRASEKIDWRSAGRPRTWRPRGPAYWPSAGSRPRFATPAIIKRFCIGDGSKSAAGAGSSAPLDKKKKKRQQRHYKSRPTFLSWDRRSCAEWIQNTRRPITAGEWFAFKRPFILQGAGWHAICCVFLPVTTSTRGTLDLRQFICARR